MKKTAFVFVHGVNEHDPVLLEMRQWRQSLKKGGTDADLLGIKSEFAFYADWFFKGSNRPDLSAAPSGVERDYQAAIDGFERSLSATGAVSNAAEDREFFGGFDITTLIPKRVTRFVLKPLFEQLFQYFQNAEIKHPQKNKTAKARDIIRQSFVDAVKRARDFAGDEGKVIVLAHSMGSVVAYDCLQHVDDCPKVDGLITFGSPLALDFVLNGLKDANGDAFKKTYPTNLKADWHNIYSRFDAAARFDTNFEAEFGTSPVHKVRSQLIVNPALNKIGGKIRLLSSAHDLQGYLRHSSMKDALSALGVASSGLERAERLRADHAPDKGSSRAQELARERYFKTETRRRKIDQEMSGTGGRLAAVESRERIVQKLRLSNIPNSVAEDLASRVTKDPGNEGVLLERILGEADFLSSSFALKSAALTSAVGLVNVETPYGLRWTGTGFMISDRLMMTNNHVLSSAEYAQMAELWFDYSMSIDGRENETQKVRLRPDQFFITSHESELDYSIVAVDVPDGGLDRPWFQLIPGSGKALVGDYVNVIQHPAGRRQEMVVRDSKVTFVGEVEDYVYYRADTLRGSSGSPVCNDQWQLAFLHHASVAKRNAADQVLNKDGSVYRDGDPDNDIDWVANEGIRISRILKDARSKLPSTAHGEMLDAALEAPDFTQYLATGPDIGNENRIISAGGQGGGGQPVGVTPAGISPDGKASWLFELSFGPAGASGVAIAPGGRTGAPSSAPLSTPAPAQQITSSASMSPTSDRNLEEAVNFLIERAQIEEVYYDEDKDRISIEEYYDGVPENGGEVKLFTEYRKLLRRTHTTEFSYSRARHQVLYPYADVHADGKLRSIYSGISVSQSEVMLSELDYILSKTKIPLSKEAAGSPGWIEYVLDYGDQIDLLETALHYNCEHVVPQSWFNKRQPMKADLHHLFTCDPKCNSYRSNFAYGDIPDYQPDMVDEDEAAIREDCGFQDDLDGVRSFEPQDGKGAVARATLYFLLRYPGEIGDSDNEYDEKRIETLVEWHDKFKVSEYEKHRNRAIFLNQGNRNPLIDKPHLAQAIAFRKSLED